MAGRPPTITADIKSIQKLYHNANNVLDTRPIIAVTMRNCGCTYQEIGNVFGISRQNAKQIITKTLENL